MKKRLFTFGCSFTKYCWPTWADFLGSDFEYFENWGMPGIGNRAILERILECHSKMRFNEADTVIVQWSTHLRHDYHRFITYYDREPDISWKTAGSIFNYLNHEKYDLKWLEEFFDERSYIMHSLNAMVGAKSLLEGTKTNWLMTSLGKFELLGSDALDPGNHKESSLTMSNLWEENPEFEHYKKFIWEDETKWIEPLIIISTLNKEKLFKWPRPRNLGFDLDPHPTPELHLEWLNTYLKPRLNLEIKSYTLHDLWIDNTNMVRNHADNIQDFGFILSRSLINWQKEIKGY